MRLNAQTPAASASDAIRVTVTVNADGSRTTYQFDKAKHEAIATTADEEESLGAKSFTGLTTQEDF